jgi:hypothetical protein
MEETRRRLQRAKWIIDVCDCRTNALVDGSKSARSLTFTKQIDPRREAVREAIRKAELRYHIANRSYVDSEREERDRKSFEPSRRPRRRRRRGVRANWNSGSDQPRKGT